MARATPSHGGTLTKPSPDPRFFYTVAYRLGLGYGLPEQPRDPLYPDRLGWWAKPGFTAQIEAFADSLVIRAEDGTTHRLHIAPV